ncbi:MAG: ribbon-helix-helix protein, CopG family [Thermofilum sp.]|uniref:ribbon-helix-helix protein, CopG family n=1 Tax=Thermofilum sp. TaxID=1961369 RepID=UPI00258D7E9D|nr:ribbon-helix-helix protein, CopG family [Thermofilum sp.]MCI4407549.1 ribbon-helix-helix protein, CopG family [Thermofilum sp.]
MRVVTVKFPEELLVKLDIYANEHGLSRSEAIREALECYLEEKSRETGEFNGVRT